MKKALTIICIVVMVATLGLSLFACKDKNFGDNAIKDFEPITAQMGLKKPTQAPKTEITKDSTAAEVLSAVNDNFLNADFVATYLRGNVLTTVLGGIEVEQAVVGNKMRHGKATDADVEFWADNRSFSNMAAVYDETYMKNDKNVYRSSAKGDIKYSNSRDKKANGDKLSYVKPQYYVDGKLEELNKKEALPPALDTWKFSPNAKSFDSKDALTTETVNDPRRIWMYDTFADGVIKEASKLEPVGDDKYKLSVEFNFTDDYFMAYKKVLEYMLVAGAGKVEGLTLIGLRFDLVIWDNGYLSDLYIQEQYSMKVAGIINSDVTLNSRQQYSYDEKDKDNNFIVKHLNERRMDAVNNWAK